MEAEKLRERQLSNKAAKQYEHFRELLTELSSRAAVTSFNATINKEVSDLNEIPKDVTEKEFLRRMEKTKSRLFSKLAKEHKIVPQHYYRNLWLALGMSSFGIPLGVAFGILMGNMAMLAVGFPVGMAIGMAYGTHLDKRAKDEGRQLSLGLQPQ